MQQNSIFRYLLHIKTFLIYMIGETMINILLVEKDINICQKILTEISQKNSNIRFCGLVSSSQDMYNFIKQNNTIIDLII